MTPFWDPNFTPPCGQLAAPYLYAHEEPGPNSKLYTQMEVLGPASYPGAIGLALTGQATRENGANFGDFGIMTPLDEPVVPGCRDLRGNQVG